MTLTVKDCKDYLATKGYSFVLKDRCGLYNFEIATGENTSYVAWSMKQLRQKVDMMQWKDWSNSHQDRIARDRTLSAYCERKVSELNPEQLQNAAALLMKEFLLSSGVRTNEDAEHSVKVDQLEEILEIVK